MAKILRWFMKLNISIIGLLILYSSVPTFGYTLNNQMSLHAGFDFSLYKYDELDYNIHLEGRQYGVNLSFEYLTKPFITELKLSNVSGAITYKGRYDDGRICTGDVRNSIFNR